MFARITDRLGRTKIAWRFEIMHDIAPRHRHVAIKRKYWSKAVYDGKVIETR